MSAYTDYLGDDAEQSYKDAFGSIARRNGGVGDGGVDIVLSLNDSRTVLVQVKSSAVAAEKFWAGSILRKNHDHRFICLAVGAPGEKAEMLSALANNGFWIGSDIQNREVVAKRLAVLRDRIR